MLSLFLIFVFYLSASRIRPRRCKREKKQGKEWPKVLNNACKKHHGTAPWGGRKLQKHSAVAKVQTRYKCVALNPLARCDNKNRVLSCKVFFCALMKTTKVRKTLRQISWFCQMTGHRCTHAAHDRVYRTAPIATCLVLQLKSTKTTLRQQPFKSSMCLNKIHYFVIVVLDSRTETFHEHTLLQDARASTRQLVFVRKGGVVVQNLFCCEPGIVANKKNIGRNKLVSIPKKSRAP